MAVSTLLLQKWPLSLPSTTSLYHSRIYGAKIRIRARPISLSIVNAQSDVKKEDIVIIGAGIAGLATAVSLQRLGIRSLVLEQSETLRTEGTSITLFKNGWKVLDAIGVGSNLRSQFLEIEGKAMVLGGMPMHGYKYGLPNFSPHANYSVVSCKKNVAQEVGAQGFNPGLIVLILVGGLLLAFLVGNYVLYVYAQKSLPPKKKKPVSKKKMKRERLKQGVSAPGE